jgi:hypothetical protein
MRETSSTNTVVGGSFESGTRSTIERLFVFFFFFKDDDDDDDDDIFGSDMRHSLFDFTNKTRGVWWKWQL